MKTFSLKKEDIKKDWILIDAKDAVLAVSYTHQTLPTNREV